jgi:hypothetical protein
VYSHHTKNHGIVPSTLPQNMDVELECAVYGEGTVFPMKIAGDAKVSALQKAQETIRSTVQVRL